MCRKQLCPKCGSDAMLYYDRNAIWICGKCRQLFSSYMDEIACDDALFHKLLLYLACEQDTLRDELIDDLPDPRVLISIESEEDEEEESQNEGLSSERRIVYQEVYHMLQALQPSNRRKIPQNILDFIDQARDKDFVPAFDITKGKEETKKISKDALALFAYLNMKYMCSSEEKEKLQRTYEENEVKHQKARTDFLCRKIREADEFDWVGQSEQMDQFPKLCAEVCRAMDYLPADITDKLFTDEDLIQLLKCRDYGHYSEMKDKLLVYNRMTEKFEYKGSAEALGFLRGLAQKNDCEALLGDSDQPDQEEVVTLGRESNKLTSEEVSQLRKAAKAGNVEAHYKLGAYLFDKYASDEKQQWEGFTHLKHVAKAGYEPARAMVEEISHAVDRTSPFFHERVFHEHDMLIFDLAQKLLRGELASGSTNDELNMMKTTSLCAMAAFTFKMSPEQFYTMEGENEQTGVAYAELAGIMYEMAPGMPVEGIARILGEWYLNGEHVERDIERAYFWLEKSARLAGDEKVAEFLEQENMAVGSERMEGINQWIMWGYPACVTALMGEYWMKHHNMKDGQIAIQIAAQKGDAIGACRVAEILWDRERKLAIELVNKAYARGNANLELLVFKGRIAEEAGEYENAYNTYYNCFAAGSSQGLYRLACLCYDGKFQPGEQDGKSEAAAWLKRVDHIRPTRINQNSYIYVASKEDFPKTRLALQCVQKLESDEAFRAKYGDCTLDEMVEQAKENGDIIDNRG